MIKYYLVYKITNVVNNKIYVGKHYGFDDDKYFASGGLIIQRAIKKYGKRNFIKETIKKYKSLEKVNKGEKYWIKKLNSFHPNDHPNRNEIIKKISLGGKNRWKNSSAKFKRNHSESRKGNKNGMYGKIHTNNSKKEMSEKIKKKWKNIDFRNKIINKSRNKKISESKRKKFDKVFMKKYINMYHDSSLTTKNIKNLLKIGHTVFNRLKKELNFEKRKYKRK